MYNCALITGASSGIGEQYARQLAEKGIKKLILVARRKERLEKLKEELSSDVYIFSCDLSDENERKKLCEDLDQQNFEVDLLINNAGFGSVGSFSKTSLQKELDMVKVNCIAPVHLSRRFLEKMKEKGSGTIINVCSTVSFQPIPYMATYGSTKAFLLSFSLALAAENPELKIMAHCPGPTHTEFHLAAGLPKKMTFLPAITAEQSVKLALNALSKEKSLHIDGLVNNALRWLAHILPPTIAAKLVENRLRKYAGISNLKGSLKNKIKVKDNLFSTDIKWDSES